MRKRFLHLLAGAVIVVLLGHCAQDRDLVIDARGNTALVFGTVTPADLRPRVALVTAYDTLAVTTTDGEGTYVFRDVAEGRYEIVASSGEWFAEKWIGVGFYLEEVSPLRLIKGGIILSAASFADGDTVTFTDLYRDSVLRVDVRFRSAFVAEGTGRVLKIEPSYLADIVHTGTDGHDLEIEIPAGMVFRADSLALTIEATLAGSAQTESVRLVCPVDTAGFDSLTTARLIDDWQPRDGAEHVGRESAIMVEFDRSMDQASVERGITLEPAAALNFFWSDEELTMVPANSLEPSTEYTVTIDTSVMTRDSVRFRVPIQSSFTTGDPSFFDEYWPLDGAKETPRNVPFDFSSRYTLDSALFVEAFSIEPEPDTLALEQVDESCIRVRHSELLADTTYTIVIDSSLSSRKGTLLGADKAIVFDTEAGSR